MLLAHSDTRSPCAEWLTSPKLRMPTIRLLLLTTGSLRILSASMRLTISRSSSPIGMAPISCSHINFASSVTGVSGLTQSTPLCLSQNCRHEVVFSADPDEVEVASFQSRMKCSECGGNTPAAVAEQLASTRGSPEPWLANLAPSSEPCVAGLFSWQCTVAVSFPRAALA